MNKQTLKRDPRTGAWPSFTVTNGSQNQIILSADERTQVTVLEYEDTLFRLESAVVPPEREIPSAEGGGGRRISALGLAAEVLRLLHDKNQGVAENDRHKILVAGHTDTSGNLDYNRTLSQNRAKTVLALLTGDSATFAEICHQLNRWMRVADYQQILTWLAETRGWDCHPGPINDKHGGTTQTAVNNFRRIYNQSGPGSSWAPPIKPEWDDPNTRQTWVGYFNCYQEYLAQELGTTIGGLADYRACISYAFPTPWVGCNEYHPRSWPGVDNLREQDNRRVEVMLFEPRENHASLACCPQPSGCNQSGCVLYAGKTYVRVLRTPGCQANQAVVARAGASWVRWGLGPTDFLFKIADDPADGYFSATSDFWLHQSGLRLVDGADCLELVLSYLENQNNFVGVPAPRIHILVAGSGNRARLRLRVGEQIRTLELPYLSGDVGVIDRGDFQWFFARKWPAGLGDDSRIYLHGCTFGDNACLTHTFWELLGAYATLLVPRTELTYASVEGPANDDLAGESDAFGAVGYAFFGDGSSSS